MVTRRAWRFDPAPGSNGLAFDIDLELVWSRLCEATREAVTRAGVSPERVAGIAATGMRMGTVLLDREGEALLAVPNRDARAVGPALELAARHGEELHRRTGHWPCPIFAAPRLQWLRDQRPELHQRLSHVLGISDWLAWMLCGERVTEPTQAGGTLLFDLERRAWAEDWIEKLGLSPEVFPEVLEPGRRLGGLTRAAADALGLRAGTPVAVGGGDTQCGLLGAGALAPGDVAAVAGTTGPIQQVTDRPIVDPQARIWAGHHLLPGRWVLESNAGPLGEALDWIARVLFPEAPDPVVRLLGEAATSVPGARGLLSSLGAEVMNARALRMHVGSLTLSHLGSSRDPSPRRHLARAIVEGMVCSMRANLEQIEEVSGLPSGPLRLTGGLSRSGTFVRILGDLLGDAVQVTAGADGTALGAALCAAVGAGIFSDLEAAAAELVRMKPGPAPVAGGTGEQAELYTRWSKLREARDPADAEAAALAIPFALSAHSRAAATTRPRPRPGILVTADLDARSLAALRDLGEVEYASFRERKRMLTGPALREALAGRQVFITEIDLVDAAALRQLPELRVIGACRGDAVNVDLEACTAFGIPVLNAPGRNAGAVADLTIAFLLMLARKLPEATSFLRQPGLVPGDMGAMGRAFATLQGRELWRKTIGLIGMGAVGRQVARRLQGFGARVLVSDPRVDAEQAALSGATSVGLEELLAGSDFVSLHAAVTPETTGMVGAAELARMKAGACLINTARAALVDEEALIEALRAQRLGGAALDTFAVEPPGADHPLLAMPSVIHTPHVGGNTVEVSAHQGAILVEDLRRLLGGERPLHALNPESLDRFHWSGERPTPSPEEIERLARRPAPAVSDLQRAPVPAGPAAPPLPPVPPPGVPPETRDRMSSVLEEFVRCIVADEKVVELAEGQDVTLHFQLTDLGLAFHFHLGAGDELRGALGVPAGGADVELRMRAAVFDGMFTGGADPVQAAMDGRLSFTGDAAKAMTLQHLQADLERLYRAARARAGPPGDLEALPGPDGDGGAAVAAPPPEGSADLRERMVATVRELYEGGIITGTGGNLSVRIPGRDEIWITPSHLFKGDLAPEGMVRIDLEGRSLDPGARSPSSEWALHCAILRSRSDVEAVIHAHAPHATILADAGLSFLPVSTEAAFFGDLPRVPFLMPGTRELATAVVEAMGDGWAVLLVNHGLVIAGRSLRRAADMAEIIERTAQMILGCRAVGREPTLLPGHVIETLRRMGDLIA